MGSEDVGVRSQSAKVSRSRPFYARHAEAYDVLVTDPVEPWVSAVHDRLVRAGWPVASVLDAGCGTGRHAAALAALGHRVDLVDASENLLAQAAARCPEANAIHADLCRLVLDSSYQGVTCRGVLNDIINDGDRDAVLRGFAGLLSEGGLLFLDVREEGGSRERADATLRRRIVTLVPDRSLEFATTVTWVDGLLHVHEEYILHDGQQQQEESTYDFVMRPWTEREVAERLTSAGFHDIEIGPGVGRTTRDRLFVVAAH